MALKRHGQSDGGKVWALTLLAVAASGAAFTAAIIAFLARSRDSATRSVPLGNPIDSFFSSSDANAHDEKVGRLTKGLDKDSSVLSIPMSRSWKETNPQSERTILCLGGQGVAKVGAERSETTDIVLSPNAIATLAPHTPFEISNTTQEPLLLLALQPASK